MKANILKLLIAMFMFSCNDFPKDKLTIIDNIVLPQSNPMLIKQMDSLSIPHGRFYTKELFTKYDELDAQNNTIHMFYTKTLILVNTLVKILSILDYLNQLIILLQKALQVWLFY